MNELRELDFYDSARVATLEASLEARRHGFVRTAVHRMLRRRFVDFDVNAWLGMYPMTYLSAAEWGEIIPEAKGALLDVGAGSGDLTRTLAPRFASVTCTETSKGMAAKLKQQGYGVHHVDIADGINLGVSFDAVSILHVLDRCVKPIALLKNALRHARDGATVVIAVPLPYDPFVDRGKRTDTPVERLVPERIEGVRESRAWILKLLLELGVRASVTARVPYLCPGDSAQPFYSLESHLFVGTYCA